jgi:hypothetical protein
MTIGLSEANINCEDGHIYGDPTSFKGEDYGKLVSLQP